MSPQGLFCEQAAYLIYFDIKIAICIQGKS